MKSAERKARRRRAREMLKQAGLAVTAREVDAMEVVDFGLDDGGRTGLQIVVYVNNSKYCAKEMVLFGRQTCPQHRHPPRKTDEGKMETFRCRWGKVWLYVPGPQMKRIRAHIPPRDEWHYTVFHEIELKPGDQHTIPPDTLHWFQAGKDGAVVSEFSSPSTDETDVFTDPRIKR
jgi:D-lyxose ketol-isomerase